MEDYRLGRGRGAIPRSHKIAQCRERTSEQANKRTGEQGCSSFVVRSKGVERLRGARLAEGRAIDWERLRKTGKRANKTTRRRDDGTAGHAEKTQAFSVVLSRARQCEAVRGSLTSEGLQMCREMKVPRMGHTMTYFPFAASEFRGADAPLSRQGLSG